MDFKSLLQRAIEIRKKYAELEVKNNGREWTSLNIMEGFVGDVGDLMKLVMAKEGLRQGQDIDENLAHELADCLWSILVLSSTYKIDLERSFLQTMDELEKSIGSEIKQ